MVTEVGKDSLDKEMKKEKLTYYESINKSSFTKGMSKIRPIGWMVDFFDYLNFENNYF